MSDLTWFKSSRSCEAYCVEVAWRKSCVSEGHCVEVAALPAAVLCRDSKDTAGPVLSFTPAAWSGFIGGLKAGDLRP